MANPGPCIVVIEDDHHISDLVALYLRRDGFRVLQADDAESGLGVIDRERPRELVARVHAILRRSDASAHGATAPTAGYGSVAIDLGRREVMVDGVVVALATREFDLLAFLIHNEGLALSRQQLLDGVWGPDWYGDERTVDVHVRQLRKKLGTDLPLATVWGVGYRLG